MGPKKFQKRGVFGGYTFFLRNRTERCSDLENGCAGDLNGDNNWNILDIVNLVNCILSDNCGDEG